MNAIKEQVRNRKKLRKKGMITDHNAINNGVIVYSSTLRAVDGPAGSPAGPMHATEVTIGKHPNNLKYWGVVSCHSRKIKAKRPLMAEERIKHLLPFPRGENPIIVLSTGERINTVNC